MPYDKQKELKKVLDYYSGDPLQSRFSALVTGETGTGKSYMLRTARKPIHIDSFDPGGTKCLKPWIDKGEIVADTSYENEDPFNPTAYARWKKNTEIRFQIDYYSQFGTYALEGLSTFGDAVMNAGLALRNAAGTVPMRNKDYNPQKIEIINYIRKLMNLPCDFILTGHLREIRNLISIDVKSGIKREEVRFRLLVTGQAVVTIPLLFDELYVILGDGKGNPKREMLTDSLGMYLARSRLKSDGKIDGIEKPDIKGILKKAGLKWEDKPALSFD